MNKRPAIHCTVIGPTSVLGPIAVIAVFLGAQTLSVSEATAQSAGIYASENPYVTVDMSVLDAGSSAAAAKLYAPGAGFTGTLLVPQSAVPVSRLHVTPQGGAVELPASEKRFVTLKAPAAATSRAVPPATPPVSTMGIPGKTLPEPAPEKMAAPVKPTAPVKPVATAAIAPAAKAKLPKPTKTAAAVSDAKPADAPPPEPAIAPPAPPPPPGTAKPAPEPAKVAALTPAKVAGTDGGMAQAGGVTKVVFEPSVSKLPEGSQDVLKALVDKVIDKSNLRLQLLAYAGGESLSSSKARRLSLSRALSVRSFLIENGLRSTRIDVRALGDRTDEKPVNRVDINVVER